MSDHIPLTVVLPCRAVDLEFGTKLGGATGRDPLGSKMTYGAKCSRNAGVPCLPLLNCGVGYLHEFSG